MGYIFLVDKKNKKILILSLYIIGYIIFFFFFFETGYIILLNIAYFIYDRKIEY